jgi:hypothetical protein
MKHLSLSRLRDTLKHTVQCDHLYVAVLMGQPATVKCRFNERRSNEIFSKTKFFSGPHKFTMYLYVKMFHFNEYHYNENISLTQ